MLLVGVGFPPPRVGRCALQPLIALNVVSLINELFTILCTSPPSTLMRPVTFTADRLAEALHGMTIATLPDLCAVLGNCSASTVKRKLKQLDYLSSYSHRGRFYALRARAHFDAHGLWFHNGIRFSSHGTLRTSARTLVEASPLGYRAVELDGVLQVRTIDALAHLVRSGDLARVRIQGRSVYCSADPKRQQHQVAARRIQHAGSAVLLSPPDPTQTDSALSAAIALFCSVLNEKQRRLFAGLISLWGGYGGDQHAASVLGLHRKTVRKGRLELTSGELEVNRIRKPGGGRKPSPKDSRG